MESWDILNIRGKSTGRTVVRGNVRLNPGEYHLVVHIWILGSDNKILLQRRSKNKELMPGEWAATGGAAVSGETSVMAAKRELHEELGILTSESEFKFVKRRIRKNSFVDIWLVETDISLSDLELQRSEVCDVKWADLDELDMMIKLGQFHNYGYDYFNVVFRAIKKEFNISR